MFNQTIFLTTLRQELKKLSNPQVQKSYFRFFKEPVKFYGIPSTAVQKIAKEKFQEIKTLDKNIIFWLCEELFKSDYSEESFIASNLTYALKKQFQPEDFTTFAWWIQKYINNRAKCDTFCNHTLGDFIQQYPQYISELKKRTRSSNRRVKRAAAVTFIIPAKQGKFLNDIFQIADSLLMDTDDMVQKWYGWMLKVASQVHEKKVFEYVMKHKATMPRTALRYAIEKMPKALKVEAMKK